MCASKVTTAFLPLGFAKRMNVDSVRCLFDLCSLQVLDLFSPLLVCFNEYNDPRGRGGSKWLLAMVKKTVFLQYLMQIFHKLEKRKLSSHNIFSSDI